VRLPPSTRRRRRRGAPPLAGYRQLCRELAAAGPGTFGELDTRGARSVLRRYSDAWFSAAKRRKAGNGEVRFPRRRRRLLPVRCYHGTFRLHGRKTRLPTAAKCAVVAAPGPRHPLPGRTGAVGDPAGRRWPAVAGSHRRGACGQAPGWRGARSGAGRGGGPGCHPSVCGRRPRRPRAVGVRTGHPWPGSPCIWSTNAVPRRPARPADAKSANPEAGF
jgi:hypothetical protein